jgi:DNA invertase Pin-like site-specific DNA recombinase
VAAYAKANKLRIEREFYDAAVKGKGSVLNRPGFVALIAHCEASGIRVVLVENASRFARDLVAQIHGHDLLISKGIELVPVDAPNHFTDLGPTAKLIRNVLGTVAEYEKDNLVEKLRHARDRKRAATGRCEGRTPPPKEHIAAARRLARIHIHPKTGKPWSTRKIAAELALAGLLRPSVPAKNGRPATPAQPYTHSTVARMLKA